MRRYRRLIIYSAICLILFALYQFLISPRYVVPILMYHRFGYGKGSLYVTPENFERQIAYLKNKGYNVIRLDELIKGIRDKKNFPHNTVVITIDDGYKDLSKYAYPILVRYNLPATIFLVAQKIGNDPEYLTWAQINNMSEQLITVGAHTSNHTYLPSIKDNKVLYSEIFDCKKIIESKINRQIKIFSYPTGGFNERIKKLVKDAGYIGACTTNRGYDKLNKDVFELKRVKIKNTDTHKPFSFWLKLSGYYNIFRRCKSGD